LLISWSLFGTPFLEIYKFDQVWIHFFNNSHTASGGVCRSSTSGSHLDSAAHANSEVVQNEALPAPFGREEPTATAPLALDLRDCKNGSSPNSLKWYQTLKHHCRFGPKYPVEYVIILQCWPRRKMALSSCALFGSRHVSLSWILDGRCVQTIPNPSPELLFPIPKP
jgi:hypothetical protein